MDREPDAVRSIDLTAESVSKHMSQRAIQTLGRPDLMSSRSGRRRMALMEETRRAGRKRCEETRHAILKAAFELLEEGGMGKLTIEGVAARSGSAKTTIYRWWPTKGKLAAEAFILFTQTAAVPPVTGSAVEDLKEHMRLLAAIFRSTTGRIIAGLIAEGH